MTNTERLAEALRKALAKGSKWHPCDPVVVEAWAALAAHEAGAQERDTIAIQEAWEAAGGNPGIKATKAELLEALRQLDAVCDEAAARAPAPEPEPLHLGACLTDGKLHATVMHRESNGRITVVAAAEIDESSLRAHDCHAVMTTVAAKAEPAGEAVPVAWMLKDDDARTFIFRTVKPVVKDGETVLPLYTHPPTAPAAEPLTDAEIKARIVREFGTVSPPGGYSPDAMVDAFKLGARGKAPAAEPAKLTDEQKQQINIQTGAGHSLICLVESYIRGIGASGGEGSDGRA